MRIEIVDCETSPVSSATVRHQLGALVVLRHVADLEGVEQRAHVRLDGLDADEQRRGDLAVRRRAAAALERRPAELDQHLALRVRRARRDAVDRRRRAAQVVVAAGVEDQLRPPDAHDVAVAQHVRAVDARGVDQRAVRRAAVLDRPGAADLLEQRVRARDLGVPRQRAARSRAAGRSRAGRGPGPSSTIRSASSPSRYSRNAVPARCAAMTACSSAGVRRCSPSASATAQL